MITIEGKCFLNEKELADHLGMSVSWIRKCRYEGSGVQVSKLGRSVRYAAEDVMLYKKTLNVQQEH